MLLPNCLIIGVPKAGTTALYRYLGEHPEIFMSQLKEPNFFAYDGGDSASVVRAKNLGITFPIKTLEAYQELFRDSSGYAIRGEATPGYLGSAVAAHNIRRTIPEAKLIASLRDPVERAFSGYLMHTRRAAEKRKIEDAFTPDTMYVKVSFYYDNLKRYFDLFPREQIEIVLFDDLKKDTLGTVQQLFRYLKVDPKFQPDVTAKHNVGSIPRSTLLNALLVNPRLRQVLEPVVPATVRDMASRLWRRNLVAAPKLPPDLRCRLIELYREDILRVQDLIERDLSAWLGEA